MKELTILKPGTEVTLFGGLHAVIVAVMIEDFDRVSYKVMWTSESDLKSEWVAEFIILKSQQEKIRVGFGSVS